MLNLVNTAKYIPPGAGLNNVASFGSKKMKLNFEMEILEVP
jgi:hypothetical protein